MTAATDIVPPTLFHHRYLSLVDEIERLFPVASWRAGDLEIWPLARMDLYLEIYRASVGMTPTPLRPLLLRACERYATDCMNLWKCRHDLRHWVGRPQPANAILLGDGVSLDRIGGVWRDRYGEPLIEALERRGRSTFLMQTGDLSRLPWHRPTFAANLMLQRGLRRRKSISVPVQVSGHDDFIRFLAEHHVATAPFSMAALAARARAVLSIAREFERVLQIVRPSLAFVVTYYADLGPSFLLACRRQGILSVDLQHCPQEGAHKAYGWSAVPARGYAALPAVFWHWTAADAAYVQRWTEQLPQPWHRAIHGGHLQLTPFLDSDDPAIVDFDAQFEAIAGPLPYEREILVALQPITGYRAQWEALATLIRLAPPTWRWWIRRHPAARAYQDEEYSSLVCLSLPNVIVDDSLSLPLPALLRHMSVLVSRYSGASAEALNFGVPALFLSDEARGQFASLIERGAARVVSVSNLQQAIAALPRKPARPRLPAAPAVDDTLLRLERLADDYRAMCSA